MSTLANLSIADFKHLVKLIEKKERLLKRITKINSEISAFENGAEPETIAPKKIAHRRKGAKRTKLKEAILTALREAGDQGHTAAELAEKLKVKVNNVRTWFYTTGKKVTSLKKSKDGRYSL